MPPSARHARRCRLTGPGAVCCTAACRRWVLGTVPRRRWGRHAVATRRRRESGLVNRLANAFRPGAASTSQRRPPRCPAPIRLSRRPG